VTRNIIQPIARRCSGNPPDDEGENIQEVGKEGCDSGNGGQEKSSCVTKRPNAGG